MPLFHKVDEGWLEAWLRDKFNPAEYSEMSEEFRRLYLQSVAHQLLFICDEIELNAMRATWKDVIDDIGGKLQYFSRNHHNDQP